mmetsp:Transcript_7744/g.13745  ORF Transcript_7744/g.13745 Transcript_7744/m.13745 type:complete len:210 (+) Transcript_7744:1686-2315(+)
MHIGNTHLVGGLTEVLAAFVADPVLAQFQAEAAATLFEALTEGISPSVAYGIPTQVEVLDLRVAAEDKGPGASRVIPKSVARSVDAVAGAVDQERGGQHDTSKVSNVVDTTVDFSDGHVQLQHLGKLSDASVTQVGLGDDQLLHKNVLVQDVGDNDRPLLLNGIPRNVKTWSPEHLLPLLLLHEIGVWILLVPRGGDLVFLLRHWAGLG